MKKILFVAGTAIVLLAQPALAAMNCGAMLGKYGMMVSKMNASGTKRAKMYRTALNGYDRCVAGDEFNAMKLFRMIADDAR